MKSLRGEEKGTRLYFCVYIFFFFFFFFPLVRPAFGGDRRKHTKCGLYGQSLEECVGLTAKDDIIVCPLCTL